MRKFYRNLFAMALVMLFAMNVNAAQKVLLSANFDDGSNPFGGWNNNTREVVDGVLKINNPAAKNSWEEQIAYDLSSAFLPNSEYTLTMKIKGSAAGQISVGLQNADNNYSSVGEFGTIDFDVDWVDVRVKCLCNGEGGKRLIFSFGQFEGDIYIDDVVFSVYEEGLPPGESGANDDLRWVNILTNSDLEGDDNSSFVSVENDPNKVDETGAYIRGNAEITDGIGRDGSRGIKVKSFAGAAQNWDAQFWMVVPEPLPAGTDYRVKFDYSASAAVTTETQAHATPSNYLHYDMIGNPAFSLDWQTYERTGTLSDAQAGGGTFQSIAFNLSIDKENDVEFYFDNLTFEVKEMGLLPQYYNQVILMDIGRKTNISDLVAHTGKLRLIYPNECAVVKQNGEEVAIASVEAFADGRFYIFTDDLLEDDALVEVTFTNPINPAYRIIYKDGDCEDLPDYQGKAYLNENVEVGDAVPNEFATPVVASIDPEDGSFNLPVSFNEFTVTFDKPVNCKDLVAKLGSEKLAVTPAEGYAETVKLTRTSTADLAEGAYTIEISNIHAESGVESAFWGTASYTIHIGHNLADFEEAVDLLTVLESAKAKRDACVDEIYSGESYDHLCAMITKYEAEYLTYTAPTDFRNATKTVNAAIIGMDNHRNLCDTYYSTVENAINVVGAYGESKYATMPLFIQLKEALAQYVLEDGTTLKLYDDESLQAAVDALKATADDASKLFTEGPSQTASTGIQVLVERLRLGVEALKKLGVAESDPLIVAANNALTDDDVIADGLKLRLKKEIYGRLQNPDNKLFEEKVDESTLETVTETYDMTVFVKNPNIYSSQAKTNRDRFVAESTPGWVVPDGANTPGLSWGWDADPAHDYMDCQFQTWGAPYAVEQTIADLPAGVYTIVGSFGERDNEESAAGSFFYAKTSANAEGEYAASIDAPVIGQSFPVDNVMLENVVVTDGILTVGAVGGPASHTFFNQVKVKMAGVAPGFDYAAAYKEVEAGIGEAVANPAQVVGIELYDLNGRRLMKAQRGIVIMKKFMSDGTIVAEKLFKK